MSGSTFDIRSIGSALTTGSVGDTNKFCGKFDSFAFIRFEFNGECLVFDRAQNQAFKFAKNVDIDYPLDKSGAQTFNRRTADRDIPQNTVESLGRRQDLDPLMDKEPVMLAAFIRRFRLIFVLSALSARRRDFDAPHGAFQNF